MDDRLHRALDGDIAPHELTPDLASRADETRALLDGVVRAVPVQPLPSLAASVLRRIEADQRTDIVALHTTHAARPRRRGFAEWLWSSQQMSISVRPAYALAAAAVFAIVLGVGRQTFGGDPAAPAVAASASEVLVRFELDAPQARTVTLAGNFSDWTPAYTMQRADDGVWTIVVPLTPGVHEYAFVVDGARWMPDPAAPAQPDGFGGMNSRIAVLRPDARS